MTSYAAYEAGYTAGFNLGRPLSGPEIEAWNRQAARGWHSALSADFIAGHSAGAAAYLLHAPEWPSRRYPGDWGR